MGYLHAAIDYSSRNYVITDSTRYAFNLFSQELIANLSGMELFPIQITNEFRSNKIVVYAHFLIEHIE
jgi:hypothetical protein